MLNPKEIKNNAVKKVMLKSPIPIQQKLMELRQLIIEVAMENSEVGELQETLKWGEMSYLAKKGSTVRIAWKASTPDEYGIYFNCKTKLIDTFREVYQDIFRYAGNRAILFTLNDQIPRDELKNCILLSLTYHQVKHLPLLGI